MLLVVVGDIYRNLPYKITNEEIYDIFGKYGDIRQIRVQGSNFTSSGSHSSGETKETRGTAFVVYEDIYDAKDAVEHLSGFNVGGRYLVVLYFQATKCGLDVWIMDVEQTRQPIWRRERRRLKN